MSQPEGRIVRRIQQWLGSQLIFHYKNHGGPNMRVGLPDIVACVDGIFVGLEVKQPGEKATAVQSRVGDEIARAGGYWACVHSLEEAQQVIAHVQRGMLRHH